MPTDGLQRLTLNGFDDNPEKPPAGSLEHPVANCSSSARSSFVRDLTTDQNHSRNDADASSPPNTACLSIEANEGALFH